MIVKSKDLTPIMTPNRISKVKTCPFFKFRKSDSDTRRSVFAMYRDPNHVLAPTASA